ncbi:hypothetical protein SAMN05428969_1063 [Devosia sp. YR412]|uniref:CBASS oligonucleotide cyclase n=1 Tax=Devosia sp. YR412 TaxID=1881030 RepID=UPI0008B91D86|nr:CBASS oligonucleotide cyclase [Devosia sp. YR412]SEP82266.1 hypothetical protein SAMN05428969_1063 [Devosia sp. YR412]
MGGSGGGGGYGGGLGSAAQQLKAALQEVQSLAFQTELSSKLSELLSKFNDRDVQLVRERLDQIEKVLGDKLDSDIEQRFGGSVAKHTYVDGLSDIDCLMVLRDQALIGKGPQATLAAFTDALKEKLGSQAEVTKGNLAVTVRYGDGMEIQLLPAVKQGEGMKIQSSRDQHSWSKINPGKFQEALTRRNAECEGKLVPVVKLAKAIISNFPEAHQLAGYHVESLGIDAFRGYTGAKTVSAMLPHFFQKAQDRVLKPMTDSTGQSVHVDGYMGNADSAVRTNASHLLGRIAKRMSNASASGSMEQWSNLFGEK